MPLLEEVDGSLLECTYDKSKNQVLLSSRSNLSYEMLKSLEQEKSETAISKYYSVLEKLDEKYVDCVAICNSKSASQGEMKKSVDDFDLTYKEMLKKVEWEEERIDLMIRKATIDGLKINFIPDHRYDLMGKQAKDVIEQFNLIEKEIRILNLSPDAKESLDFHMYRGFVFSKFPPTMYPEQRKIAIADAMLVIYHVSQQIEDKIDQTPAFYKKMASAFTVFAKGVENPPVSLQFISLGLQFIEKNRKLEGQIDQSLKIIEQKLVELQKEFEKSMIKINLNNLPDLSFCIEDKGMKTELDKINAESIEKEFEEIDRIDRILFRTFQDYSDIKQTISNLQRSIGAYRKYIEEEKEPSKIFRAKLRSLFLRNYLNYLTNYSSIKKLKSISDQIIEEIKFLSEKSPKDDICLAELHVYRGCIYIMYPRIKDKSHKFLPYDIAIKDFNDLNEMGVHLHRDIKAFQYMIYGQHMLNYDPINAVQLLKEAVGLTYCPTVKSNSQKMLNDFFGKFNPIQSSLSFDPNSILKLK